MTISTRLSDCSNLQEVKGFLAKLKSDNESSGRSFVYINDGKVCRSYTMNQIVHRVSVCVEKSRKDLGMPINQDPWKSRRQEFRDDISEIVGTIKHLNEMADQSECRSMLSLRKKLGNVWYAFIHFGFNKEKVLAEIQKKYPEVQKSIIRSTEKICRDERLDDIEMYAVFYYREECFLTDALEDSASQAIIFKNKRVTKLLQRYANEVGNKGFTKANQDHSVQEIATLMQGLLDSKSVTYDSAISLMETKFEEVGLRLQDVLENPILYNNPLLRQVVVGYAIKKSNRGFLANHLTFVLQEVEKKANRIIGKFECSKKDMVNKLERFFKVQNVRLQDCIRLFLGYGIGGCNTYNISVNDSRLHSLMFDSRFGCAILEYACSDIGPGAYDQYKNLFSGYLVKNADYFISRANGSWACLADALITKYRSNGLSLEDAFLNRVLFKNAQFRKVLIHYGLRDKVEGFSDFYLEFISQIIIKNKDQYIRHNDTAISAALRVAHKLKLKGYSLDNILNSKMDTSPLVKDRYFRPCLVAYAKDRGLNDFLNWHLDFIVKCLIRDRLNIISYNTQTLIQALESRFKNDGRKIEELFENEKHVEVLSEAHFMLRFALIFYRDQNSHILSKELNQDDFSDKRMREAIAQGQKHAEEGDDLIASLGLTQAYDDYERDGDEIILKKALMRFLQRNHPDKNPNSDPHLALHATFLLDLINSGNLENYFTSYHKNI